MFVVTVVFRIKPEAWDVFLPLMAENARLSQEREPGCQRFDVCKTEGQPNTIFLYEVYDDRAAFDAHLQAAHYLTFSAATENMVVGKEVQFHALTSVEQT